VIRVPGYISRGPGFDSWRYQIFWDVAGLEWGPLSLVRITEELLETEVSAPVYKTEINGRGDSLRWPSDTLYPLKLALTSPTSGGRSVGIVRLRTKAPEFLFFIYRSFQYLWLYIALNVGRLMYELGTVQINCDIIPALASRAWGKPRASWPRSEQGTSRTQFEWVDVWASWFTAIADACKSPDMLFCQLQNSRSEVHHGGRGRGVYK
jgi:hypothetical protein